MKSSKVRRALAVTAVGVALFATLGEGSEEDSGSSGNSDNGGSEESSEPQVGTTREDPVPVGTEIQVEEYLEMPS